MNHSKSILLMATLLAAACSADDKPIDDSSPLEISVNAATTEISKTSGNTFSDYDKIGLTVVPWDDGSSADMTSIRTEDNVCFTYSYGVFESERPAYYPDKTTKCNFYSYYPYNEKGFPKGTNTLNVSVKTDQKYNLSLAESDYMVAVNEGVVPTTDAVPLKFRHIHSYISCNLIAAQGCTDDDLATAKLILKSFRTEAEYDVITKWFTNHRNRKDIEINHEGIVIPQTMKANVSMIYIIINNKTIAYKPASDIVFESGKRYNFDISVTITDLGPSISVSSSIEDWKDGGIISGDAKEDNPAVGSIKDIENNIYEYVEINGLYWTCANMKTTKYNDGTDIPYAEGGNSAWNALTTPAYCFFENNTENKETLGCLYNRYAINNGDICPEGWRLPSKAELSELIGEESGDVDIMTLISKQWDGMNGTNKTGFSAMPSGLAIDHWYMNDCYLWASTVLTDEELADQTDKDMKYGYLYLGQYPWTDFNYAYTGMGVRCVKEIN